MFYRLISWRPACSLKLQTPRRKPRRPLENRDAFLKQVSLLGLPCLVRISYTIAPLAGQSFPNHTQTDRFALSYLRKQVSSSAKAQWIPAFAGMTYSVILLLHKDLSCRSLEN